jgi:hypothetical protein
VPQPDIAIRQYLRHSVTASLFRKLKYGELDFGVELLGRASETCTVNSV